VVHRESYGTSVVSVRGGRRQKRLFAARSFSTVTRGLVEFIPREVILCFKCKRSAHLIT
jgi:hypothetical protein